MARMSCLLCLQPKYAADVCELLVRITESGSQHSVTICLDCARSITPALLAWMERRDQEKSGEGEG